MHFGFWWTFHSLAVALTMVHAYLPLTSRVGKQHVIGAETICLSWIACQIVRTVTGDRTPIEIYALIDVIVAGVFLHMALRNRAVWAAFIVILQGMMTALHLVRFVMVGDERVLDYGYLWVLNSLFFLTLVTTNIATAVGRHAWGRMVDEFFVARFRGWTWSGLRIPRNSSPERKG